MTQPDPNNGFKFNVDAGETVTFGVAPVGTNPMVVFGHDGATVNPVPPLTTAAKEYDFSFAADGPARKVHVLSAHFGFSPGGAPDAHYTLTVTGSNGGQFHPPSIRTTSDTDPSFLFTITAQKQKAGGKS